MKKIIKVILPMFLIVALCISGSTALLSAQTKKVTNSFELLYPDVELQEPSWDTSENVTYNSGAKIPKDPQIYNSGTQDAYVYMSVFIPKVNTRVYSSSPSFSYKDYAKSAFILPYDNVKWEELFFETSSNEITMEHNGVTYDGYIHIFAYQDVLKQGETTPPLCEYVQFISYDYDIENALEDEEALGNGTGSDVLGKTLPIIIQPHAISVDVLKEMIQFSQENSGNGKYWNYGPALGWKYYSNQVSEQYKNNPDRPWFASYTDLLCGSFTVEICDCEYADTLDTFEIYTACSEYMNLDVYNQALTDLGYAPMDSFKEMCDLSISQSYINEYYTILVWDEQEGIEQVSIKEDLCKVIVEAVKDGQTVQTYRYAFKEGSTITNETIAQRVIKSSGYFFNKYEWSTDSIEINEVAHNGDEYTVIIEISEKTTS